jgi:hypothetical protein
MLLAPAVRAQSYTGYLDAANCASIGGWAWDGIDTDTPNIYLYDGATLFATLTANGFRSDLVGPVGSGYHAYGMVTPDSLKDNQPHTIHAYYSSNPNGQELTRLGTLAGMAARLDGWFLLGHRDARQSPLQGGGGGGGVGRIIDLLLGACLGSAGALHVDLFGALRRVGQHPHVIFKHFQEAAMHGKSMAAVRQQVGEGASPQLAQKRRVAGQDPHVSVFARKLHLANLFVHQLAFGSDHYQIERVRHGSALL